MPERPILFSAPMVRAILKGRKTQTRRIAKLTDSGRVSRGGRNWHVDDPEAVIACPYGVSGGTLWVRETWANIALKGYPPVYFYRADGKELPPRDDRAADSKWRPSIFMPRPASRITLRVTDARLERLQAISLEDVAAEGCEVPRCPKCGYTRQDCHLHMDHERCGEPTPPHWVGPYHRLWVSINGTESWQANPWVWVVSFERLPKQHGGEL